MTRARALWLACAVLVAWLSARGDDGTLLARVLPSLAAAELGALDEIAGLHDDGTPRDPIAVSLDDDGPAAATVRELVADDPAYRLGAGPHRIVVELIAVEHACALRLGLERRGWIVHAPSPKRHRLLPALALVPALFGLLAWARSRDRVVGVVVAAVLAQLALALVPWPSALPQGSTLADVAAGPLVAPLVALARRLDELGTALAAGVIALCLVLAWFDHRRSRALGARTLLRGLALVAAVLALVEAATRSGWFAWTITWLGAVSTVAVLVSGLLVPRVWHDRQEPAR